MENTETISEGKTGIANFVFLVLDMILISTAAVVSCLVSFFFWPKFLQFRIEIGGEDLNPILKFFDLGIWWLALVLVVGLLLVWKQRWFGLKYISWDLWINICVAIVTMIYIVFYFLCNLALIYNTMYIIVRHGVL